MSIIDLQEIDVNHSDAKHSIGAPLLLQDPTRIPTALALEFRISGGGHLARQRLSTPGRGHDVEPIHAQIR